MSHKNPVCFVASGLPNSQDEAQCNCSCLKPDGNQPRLSLIPDPGKIGDLQEELLLSKALKFMVTGHKEMNNQGKD